MGQDKALLTVRDINSGTDANTGKNSTLLDFMQRKLADLELFDEIIICRNPETHGINPETHGIRNTRYLPDINPGLGPIGALHTLGIHYPNYRALVVPVDMPLLTAESLSQLCKANLDKHTACYYEGYYFPLLIELNTVLIACLAERLETNTRDLSVLRLLSDIPSTTITYQGDHSQFANINTAEQWQALKL